MEFLQALLHLCSWWDVFLWLPHLLARKQHLDEDPELPQGV